MNKTVLLLFIVTLAHVPYVVSSEEEEVGCWSRCMSRVTQWRCCAWIASWCKKPEQKVEKDKDIDITRTKSDSGYEFIDTHGDDENIAFTVGHVESATSSPRTSTTGTLRIRRRPTPPQQYDDGNNTDSSSSNPDLAGQLSGDDEDD